jgi:hypothetical protein
MGQRRFVYIRSRRSPPRGRTSVSRSGARSRRRRIEEARPVQQVTHTRVRARFGVEQGLELGPLLLAKSKAGPIRKRFGARSSALSSTKSLTDRCAAAAAVCSVRLASGVNRRSSVSLRVVVVAIVTSLVGAQHGRQTLSGQDRAESNGPLCRLSVRRFHRFTNAGQLSTTLIDVRAAR